jgi:hypothetical protein
VRACVARRGCRVVPVSLAHLICGTHAPMAQKTPMSILRRDESATRATHARGRRQCCFLCCWVGGPGACTHFARRSKLSPQAELGLDGKDVMARPSPIRPDMGAHPNELDQDAEESNRSSAIILDLVRDIARSGPGSVPPQHARDTQVLLQASTGRVQRPTMSPASAEMPEREMIKITSPAIVSVLAHGTLPE